MKGTVKKFSDQTGYGFIRSNDDDRMDYFVHYSDILSKGYKTLFPGQQVIFEVCLTKKGWKAFDVLDDSPIDSSNPMDDIALKPNPFMPQDPMFDPHKFAGRRDILRNAVDCIFNNKNVLITGPRGIGKSSVANQLLIMTQGELSLLHRLNISIGGIVFNYLVGDYRCLYESTASDISKGILTALYTNARKNMSSGDQKSKFTLDLKIFKYEFEDAKSSIDLSDLCTHFVNEVEKLYDQIGASYNGFCFLIDEIDVLDAKIELGSMLKSIMEKFRLDNFHNVSFILSGVTGKNTDHLSRHPSASRLFEPLLLEKMQRTEIIDIIDLALQDTGTQMSVEAKNKIADLSDCFPHPVQLLGYHAFKMDRNDQIDLKDVYVAMDFIVQGIKKQEFEDKYYTIGMDYEMELLRTVCCLRENEITIEDIMSYMRNSNEDQIRSAILNLEKKKIMERLRRGVYKISDPLFKLYLRWLFLRQH